MGVESKARRILHLFGEHHWSESLDATHTGDPIEVRICAICFRQEIKVPRSQTPRPQQK